tara:strand:- start:136 stop:384 length:249 start_codon:yes stop_codon:yes gene_type:complete
MNFNPFNDKPFNPIDLNPIKPIKSIFDEIEKNMVWIVVKKNKLDLEDSFTDIVGCYNDFQDAVSVVSGKTCYKILGPYKIVK